MSVRLLDVNILVSLLDGAHVYHALSAAWFRREAVAAGWATCPQTENAFIRVVTNAAYPNFRVTPAMAARNLGGLKSAFPGAWRFWPDDISLNDAGLFDLSPLIGSKQITDAYLAGLAHRNSGRFATIDAAIPWTAVRGATASLIERI